MLVLVGIAVVPVSVDFVVDSSPRPFRRICRPPDQGDGEQSSLLGGGYGGMRFAFARCGSLTSCALGEERAVGLASALAPEDAGVGGVMTATAISFIGVIGLIYLSRRMWRGSAKTNVSSRPARCWRGRRF